MTQVSDIVNQIEAFAPKSLAEPGDPVGLQLGCLNQEVKKVLVTLDVRPEVVAEAIAQNVQMIFSHHPAMFRPAKNLDLANPQNAMYAEILKHNLTVYSAHTNIDKAKDGMNDWLANKIGLVNLAPFAFEVGEDGVPVGLGRKGELTQSISAQDFAEKIKQEFNLTGLRLVVQNPAKMIKSVGIIGGDGGKFYQKAVMNKLDAFITGDVYYHTGHDMLASGLAVIDPGHHIEAIFKEIMTKKLTEWSTELNWNVEFVPSELSTDPYRFI